jgi:hypothetical protein
MVSLEKQKKVSYDQFSPMKLISIDVKILLLFGAKVVDEARNRS